MVKINRGIKIAPSALACDLSCLAEAVVKMEKAGADMIHLDVMDGHFVPNITFGAPVIKCLRDKTRLPFDVHLMISEPEKYAADFIKAGADMLTFHLEAAKGPDKLLGFIREQGIKAGVALKPGTGGEAVLPYLKDADMVLIMTVEPGFGGQQYMGRMEEKIRAVKKEMENLGIETDIQVDGGIDHTTVQRAYEAGANIFVAGSYLFGFQDYKIGINSLKDAVQ